MGRTHDEKRLFLLGPHPSNIPGMISGLHRFLESGVVLAIDPDEAERMERKKHGGPRADDHGNIVSTNPFPDVGPFLTRHHAVKDGCRSGQMT
jgi:hypothetical protein